MKIAQARLIGLRAFEQGFARAPALNAAFIKDACASTEDKVVDLLGAYLYGWDISNLANDAIIGSPSLLSYENIIEDAKNI